MSNETTLTLHAIIYGFSEILKVISQILFLERAQFDDEANQINYVDLHRLIISGGHILKRIYKLGNDLVGNLVGLRLKLISRDLFEEQFHVFTGRGIDCEDVSLRCFVVHFVMILNFDEFESDGDHDIHVL